MTPAEARAKLQETIEARAKAGREASAATRDFVQHRANKPNPGRGHAGDPANWNQKTDAELEKQMWEKQQENIQRINDWKTADRQYRNALAAANKAQGRSGLAASNQAPPAAPAPKPVGNENPTVPQQPVQVPGSQTGGALEVGSAGVSNSLAPGSDP
jgi:hypothetical protein